MRTARGLAMALAIVASSSAAAESPLGLQLPSVEGRSLEGRAVRFPDHLRGRAAVLLVAYRRGTQADVDLWTALLDRKAPSVPWYELPTIASPLWRPLQGWIDGGMRRGVPQPRWGRVVTLYDDAPTLAGFLGDHGGLTTHVVLLDPSGRVRWFDAAGFSEVSGQSLLDAIAAVSHPGSSRAE
jgi:hypothetical protein